MSAFVDCVSFNNNAFNDSFCNGTGVDLVSTDGWPPLGDWRSWSFDEARRWLEWDIERGRAVS